MWEKMCVDPRLALSGLRHGHKADNTPRGGLSKRGEQQVDLLLQAVDISMNRIARRGVCFYAANTLSNIDSLQPIAQAYFDFGRVFLPPALDIPFMGPNDEDATTCTALAEKLKISRNEAFGLNWEEHGFKRIGESTTASRARVRTGLEEAVRNAQGMVVIYCGNSPVMDGALG